MSVASGRLWHMDTFTYIAAAGALLLGLVIGVLIGQRRKGAGSPADTLQLEKDLAAANATVLGLSSQVAEAARERKERDDREKEALAEQNRIEVMNKGSFSKLLGKQLLEDQAEQMRAEAATEEERTRELLHSSLHGTYDGVLGLPLVHSPRALSVTLDTALELGIDLVREPHLVWLADLARALPVPLGWVPIAAPIGSVVHELWYNEVTHSSQWLHPVDETVKDLLRSLRAPMRPSSAAVVETALGAAQFVYISFGVPCRPLGDHLREQPCHL